MKKVLLIALACFAAQNAMAWSQKGHDVVAFIAEKHLTPAAADSVSRILNGKSPVYWANWLDNASHTAPYYYTKTWHYKNIEEGVQYKDAKLEPKGDVVTAVREQIAILSDKVSTPAQKELALKILIHVVGDLHQPLHLGRLSDIGGNKHKLKFFNDDSSLHTIWDGKLMNAGRSWSYTEWQEQLDRLSPEAEKTTIAGDVDQWAKQTHDIAVRAYDFFPQGCKVSYNEIAEWTPVIEEQLLRGGLRLGHILNAIFDPAYGFNVSSF